MRFEGTDCPLSGVAAVGVWRDKLELAGPIVFCGQLVGLAGLVVEDLEVNSVAAILEPHHDVVVRHDAVSVVPGLEGFDQNGICVDLVRQHNVVVAAAGADGEADHVVCVELSDGLTDDVDFLGFFGRKLSVDVRDRFLVVRFDLGGA